MKTTVLPAGRLTAAHWEAWAHLQRADPALESPFFRPEFTRAVAAVRPDVEVAVLEEAREPVAFFPFQRRGWGVGGPVGGRLSDFQGVVARPGLRWDAAELVRACGLRGWDFDHLLACQDPFRPFHAVTADSPYMDLSRGFTAYQAECKQSGPISLKRAQEKARRLGRQVGPLRFEQHTTDRAVFAALLRWKRAQYRRTRVTDVFAFSWTLGVVQRVLAESGEAFAGALMALYAGARLVAVELGMRSFGVLHSWFPAYNPDLAKYSPGLILMVEQAKAAPGLGIRRIDLGKGPAEYKASFRNGATLLAEGCVAPAPLLRLLREGLRRTRAWVKAGPLRGPARVAGRWTRPLRGWLAFRK
jgi:CelD/BcsL family acetyltransferase involved in cellulose biosynthesis